MIDVEGVGALHIGDERGDFLLVQVLDAPTVPADEMVVMARTGAQQVAGPIPCERQMLDDARFLE